MSVKNEFNKCRRTIKSLSLEEQKFLYGDCDQWCLKNFKDGLEIVAIMERNNHENGITHSYLRDLNTGYCYDIRGRSLNDTDILTYTGIDYHSCDVEEYVFYRIDDFKKFLLWVDFECMRTNFLI